MNLKEFFSLFDAFKTPISFYFDGTHKVSTILGTLLSFLMYGILFISFFQSNMIQKKDPFLSSFSSSSEEITLNLDTNNFSPIFLILDGSLSLEKIDLTFLNISLSQSNSPNIRKNIDYHKCTEQSSVKKIISKKLGFNLFDSYSFFCINETVSISKYNLLQTHKEFHIMVQKCKNGSEIICKTDEEIKDYIYNKTFVFAYLINVFQPNSYETPFSSNYQYITFALNENFMTSMAVEMMPIHFQQDDNIFWDDIEASYFFEDKKNTPILKEEKSTGTYLDLFFYSSENKKTILRKYEKISVLLSKLGGLASFFIFFGNIFVNTIIYLQIINTFLSKLFQISHLEKSKNSLDEDSDHKKILIQSLNLEKSQRLKDYLNEELQIEHNQKPKILEMNDISKKESLKQTQFDHKISWKIWKVGLLLYVKLRIKYFFKCNLSQEEKNLQLIEMEYKNQFDFLILLKTVRKLERLKNFILDENQMKIFDYLDNYPMSFENIKYEKIADENSRIQFEDFNSTLSKIQKRKEKNMIDLKLLEIINEIKKK